MVLCDNIKEAICQEIERVVSACRTYEDSLQQMADQRLALSHAFPRRLSSRYQKVQELVGFSLRLILLRKWRPQRYEKLTSSEQYFFPYSSDIFAICSLSFQFTFRFLVNILGIDKFHSSCYDISVDGFSGEDDLRRYSVHNDEEIFAAGVWFVVRLDSQSGVADNE